MIEILGLMASMAVGCTLVTLIALVFAERRGGDD